VEAGEGDIASVEYAISVSHRRPALGATVPIRS
jgi:hypothetical protein